MKNQIAGRIASLAVVGWVLPAAGVLVSANLDTPDPDQVEFPQITAQPADRDVPLGGGTVLTVQSSNADSFQWLRNGVVLDGETNSSLTLANVGVNDVGYYSCSVLKGYEVVPSRTATVTAYRATGGGMITVFGLPVVSGGGGSGSCPGPYAGYLNFVKPASQGWGWVPTAGVTLHTATDTNRTDTKIVFGGKLGDSGCAQTTVVLPEPHPSSKYRFTIYFPNNVPTNSYGITLSGFDP